MGSTAQSAQLTPSTFIGGLTQGAALNMVALESSGAYFNVGDASKVLLFITNGSTGTGAIYIEPGARWSGSLGQPVSTVITTYSTATAPIVVSIPACVSSISSAAMVSTTGQFLVVGPFESATVKSSDSQIFIGPSSSLAQINLAVYTMVGGSTN